MLIPATRDAGDTAFAWPAALFVWGPGSWSDLHRHHSVQLVMALQRTIRFRTSRHGRWTTCRAVLVRPDARHEIDARNTDVLIGFVDAESDLAGALTADSDSSDVAVIPAETIARWRAVLGDADSLYPVRVEPWVRETLLRRPQPPQMDRRIRQVLRALPEKLADADPVSLQSVATSVGLSPSRFMHLFTESVGIPLRPYILWLRLQRAAGVLARERSITDAAYAAGFADSAHFTRTFRRMLGATPRQILQRGLAARDFHL